VCTEAEVRRVARWRAKVKGQEPPVHGHHGYANYGCRCEVCRAAVREYHREYRACKRAPEGTGVALEGLLGVVPAKGRLSRMEELAFHVDLLAYVGSSAAMSA
jgi:hypothetical protein